ncbi:ATP-binding protein [Streptomyces gobiensis]|uniref:ATP-binding protein n=1 Tax=Streptomyces gobiensis TaxID=2875706 RepID=UPI001E2ED812|nr:ATP-binding protein [Streptomyces gobiensis]UGY91537.1 ATP-binding protein [Streptomyces gobiensis]
MAAQSARWAVNDARRPVNGFGAHPSLSLVRAASPEAKPVDTSGFAAWTLEPDPQSPGIARHFARSALCGWGMHELVDDIAVSVSEMVTNALRYGSRPSDPATPQPVVLSLLRQGPTVLCAVVDPGSTVPMVRGPDDLAETGRGLHIVDCLSDDWGWTTPGPSGKAVWAKFSADCAIRPYSEQYGGGAAGAAGAAGDTDWDPLTRLLLLAEILGGSGPSWLEAVGLRASEGRSEE